MKLAVAATLATALLAPSVAQGATLTVDPAQRCYRETQTIQLPGAGFTRQRPGRLHARRRGGPGQPADRGRRGGQHRPAAHAPRAAVGPAQPHLHRHRQRQHGEHRHARAAGHRHRPRARAPSRAGPTGGSRSPAAASSGGKRLWAHIKRGRGAARNVRLGRIKGACKKMRSRKRLFAASAAPGVYSSSSTPSGASAATAWPSRPSASRSPGPRARRPRPGLAPARLSVSRPRPRAARTGPRRHGGAP